MASGHGKGACPVTDLRMLHALQDIRRFALEELDGEKSQTLYLLTKKAIEIDDRIFEEKLGIRPMAQPRY